MANYCILLALLFAGGFALPAYQDDSPDFDENMSIFFDHTNTEASGRIVGGSVAAEGAYPWMVAVSTGIFQAFRCGGSVITPTHVLTAAHCVPTFGPGAGIMSPTTRVRVGTNVWNSGGQSIGLGGFRIHPNYDWFNVRNDIGILITRNFIVMNSRVAPIRINPRFIHGNVPARVSGFGRTKAAGPLSDRLLELRTHTVDILRCVRELADKSEQLDLDVLVPTVDPVAHICAFTAVNQGVCNGDSGSPLVLDINEQIGIVSWGLPCARGAPDVYVRVSTFYDWVTSVTNSTVSAA